MSKQNAKAGIKPEVLAAISAALALYGYSAEAGYQVSSVTKSGNPWKRAGIIELMLGRDMTMKDFL
ncbi:MAG: hypothetical protein PHS52_00140 [Desulfotomaculaceae bacterium]|nr:hypothetical protein [Desulfotomaculaceae bacterium]